MLNLRTDFVAKRRPGRGGGVTPLGYPLCLLFAIVQCTRESSRAGTCAPMSSCGRNISKRLAIENCGGLVGIDISPATNNCTLFEATAAPSLERERESARDQKGKGAQVLHSYYQHYTGQGFVAVRKG